MSDRQYLNEKEREGQCRELGEYYTRHVSAMTGEGLHSKSDIAYELARRDKRIDTLQARVGELESAIKQAKRHRNIPCAGATKCDNVECTLLVHNSIVYRSFSARDDMQALFEMVEDA